MKKTICMILSFLMLLCLSACSEKGETDAKNIKPVEEITDIEGPYYFQSADWPAYKNAEEVVNAADLVFLGKIVDIDFQALDSSTALSVSETTAEHSRALYTVYSVEVIDTYKGNPTSVQKVRVMGGMIGYDVDRQLKIMEEGKVYGREYGIPIWDRYQKVNCNIGETFLFALKQFETGDPTVINLEQAIYDLADPAKKSTDGISVKDIVSEFGNSKWNAFNEKWQNGKFATQK